MRVFIDQVETHYPARWFFCAPDAQLFPSPHGAEASPWLKSFEKNEEWGEVAGPKLLDRGHNPGYLGLCSVGDPQWFIDGQLPAGFPICPPPAMPSCCGPQGQPYLRPGDTCYVPPCQPTLCSYPTGPDQALYSMSIGTDATVMQNSYHAPDWLRNGMWACVVPSGPPNDVAFILAVDTITPPGVYTCGFCYMYRVNQPPTPEEYLYLYNFDPVAKRGFWIVSPKSRWFAGRTIEITQLHP